MALQETEAAKAAPSRGPSIQGLLWLAQRLSALLLVAGLAVHVAAIHLGAGAGSTWQASMARLASPGWRLFEAGFLIVVTWHALSGLWLIVEDYVVSPGVRRLLLALFLVLGGELLAVGLYTLASLPWGGGL